MPIDFNNYNFNQLKTINSIKTAPELKGNAKEREIKEKVEEIFSSLIASKDPIDKIELSLIQKILFIFKPFFFYFYFDSALVTVNYKINAFAKDKLSPFKSGIEWEKVDAHEKHTLQNVVNKFTLERKKEIEKIQSENSALSEKIGKQIKIPSNQLNSTLKGIYENTQVLGFYLQTVIDYSSKCPNDKYTAFVQVLENYHKELQKNYNKEITNLGNTAFSRLKNEFTSLLTDSCKEKSSIETRLNQIEDELNNLSPSLETEKDSDSFEDNYEKIKKSIDEISQAIDELKTQSNELNQLKLNLKTFPEITGKFDIEKDKQLADNGLLLTNLLIEWTKQYNEASQYLLEFSIKDQIALIKTYISSNESFSKDVGDYQQNIQQLDILKNQFEKNRMNLDNAETLQKKLSIAYDTCCKLQMEKNELVLKNKESEEERNKIFMLDFFSRSKFKKNIEINDLRIQEINKALTELDLKHSLNNNQIDLLNLENTIKDKKGVQDQECIKIKIEFETTKNQLDNVTLQLNSTQTTLIDECKKAIITLKEFKSLASKEPLKTPTSTDIENDKVVTESKKIEIRNKNIINKPSTLNDYTKFWDGMINLQKVLLGDSLDGDPQVNVPYSEIIYNLILIGSKLFKEGKNPEINILFPAMLNLFASNENTKNQWINELNEDLDYIELNINKELDLINYAISLIFNQNISFSQLLKDFSTIPPLKIKFDINKLPLLEKYTKTDDLYFSNRENIDEEKKKDVISILKEILGNDIEPFLITNEEEELSNKKLSLNSQLLLMEVLRGFGKFLNNLPINTSEKCTFNNAVLKLTNFHVPVLSDVPLVGNFNLLKLALKMPTAVINGLASLVASEEKLKKELGLKKDKHTQTPFDIRDRAIKKIFEVLTPNSISNYVSEIASPYLNLIDKLNKYRSDIKDKEKIAELNSAINTVLPIFLKIGPEICQKMLNDKEGFIKFLDIAEKYKNENQTDKKKPSENRI